MRRGKGRRVTEPRRRGGEAAAAELRPSALKPLGVRGVSQPGRTGWPYSPTVSFLSRIQISAQVSEGDCQKEKRGVGGSPGSCAPGQWEGGAGQSAASQDARKCCGVRPIPQPACPSPSLSPPLTSPPPHLPPVGYSFLPRDATSRNRLFCCCFGAGFSLAAQRGCERWRGRRAGGAARRPPAGPRGAERRTDSRPGHLLSRAHSSNSC